MLIKEVRKNYLNFINKTKKEFNLNTHSCYDYFLKENVLEQLDLIGSSFLLGDFHYNSEGYKILANCIKDKIKILSYQLDRILLNHDRIILNQEDREMIKKYYEDDNIKLSRLLNIDLKRFNY